MTTEFLGSFQIQDVDIQPHLSNTYNFGVIEINIVIIFSTPTPKIYCFQDRLCLHLQVRRYLLCGPIDENWLYAMGPTGNNG
jgi:hypothetical protein